jgi:hypothetical protein
MSLQKQDQDYGSLGLGLLISNYSTDNTFEHLNILNKIEISKFSVVY